MPSAASSCSVAAVITSAELNKKPSSLGGWAKIHPTLLIICYVSREKIGNARAESKEQHDVNE